MIASFICLSGHLCSFAWVGRAESGQSDHHALEVTHEELAMQGADTLLTAVRKAAEGTPGTALGGFFNWDGLIYLWLTPLSHDTEEMAIEQLVLPQQCCKTALHLAHTIPLAGHRGKDKTARWILQRFYWPALYNMWQNPVEPIRLPEDIILQRPRRTSQYLANATMLGRSTLLLILAGSCYAEKNTIPKFWKCLAIKLRVQGSECIPLGGHSWSRQATVPWSGWTASSLTTIN